jgi:hypothetical protein
VTRGPSAATRQSTDEGEPSAWRKVRKPQWANDLDTDNLRREAARPERLIEGEDPAATDAATVEHWLLVYGQLLGTKSGLLADLRKGMKTMDPTARDEMVKTDEMLLAAQVERFRRRIAFWESRLRRDG